MPGTFFTDRPPRSAFPVLRPMQTRWHDNDHYGHVNNVIYYSYFDTAVNGWLIEASGRDIRDLPAIGVVAETACRFLGPIGFPDPLSIGLASLKLGRTSATYGLAVFRADDQHPAALGRFVHVYVDGQTRRPVDIPPELRAILDPLRASTSESFARAGVSVD
jgi:acyl-CoA thioester hydrolase